LRLMSAIPLALQCCESPRGHIDISVNININITVPETLALHSL